MDIDKIIFRVDVYIWCILLLIKSFSKSNWNVKNHFLQKIIVYNENKMNNLIKKERLLIW